MPLLRRKIDDFLNEWKSDPQRLPLVVKGARQIGKTASLTAFARSNYSNFVYVNFALEPKYASIFSDGYSVDDILRNMSFIDPAKKFIPGQTLIFFDELQACPDCATSLKSFKIDGRYDVVCSGSLMGINYQQIESNSVGYKVDYEMHSMDFEEFLWAKGYSDGQINVLLDKMRDLSPLPESMMNAMLEAFRDYIVIGGMPAVVADFVETSNFGNALRMQRQLLLDYEEDITKYAQGLDKGKIKSVYNHITVSLGQVNKKFQITKVARGARSREYIGTVDWLNDAGIVNVCYCLDSVSLPLKGNYNPKSFKLYYRDTGLLVASLDEESQDDLRINRNFDTYKGAVYENIVADMLVKQGYSLYYYANEKSTLEIDFFVRDKDSLVPVEVKAGDNVPKSMLRLIESEKYPDVKYGIKFGLRNIGFDGRYYTFPYFLCFLLKRFIWLKSFGVLPQ